MIERSPNTELELADLLRISNEQFHIGISINTGNLMLGTVGGHSPMDSTVISDAVNLADQVETLTKNYQVPLLITHERQNQVIQKILPSV